MTRLSLIPVLLLVIAGCSRAPESGTPGSSTSDSQTTLDMIRQTKVLRVGYANEAPYAYKDTASGRLTGEAPEIARYIAGKLGDDIQVEGVLTEFGSLIPGLKAGRFDVIAAGMYIKPERCAEVDFSNPTYGIGEGFLVLKDNPKGLHSYVDVRDHKDATIGVVNGAVELGYAEAIGVPEKRIKVFPDAPSAVDGVRAGRVDCYAGTALTVQDLLDKDKSGRIERALPFSDPVIDGKTIRGYGAFGFRKADSTLRDAFNKQLATFIGSPEHADLVRPFGFTPSELPGDVTADQLCAGE